MPPKFRPMKRLPIRKTQPISESDPPIRSVATRTEIQSVLNNDDDVDIIVYPRSNLSAPLVPSSPLSQFADENVRPTPQLMTTHVKALGPKAEHDPGFVVWEDGGIYIPPPRMRRGRKPFGVLYQRPEGAENTQEERQPLAVVFSAPPKEPSKTCLLLELSKPVLGLEESPLLSPLSSPCLGFFESD